MSVYVDDMRAKFGRMIMCHMVADTTEELLAMADKIGVQRKWIQHAGSPKEHFDICLQMKSRAMDLGAKAITQRDLAQITIAKFKGKLIGETGTTNVRVYARAKGG